MNKFYRFAYRVYLNLIGVKLSNSVQGYGFLFGNRRGLKVGNNIWIEKGVRLNLCSTNATMELSDFVYINAYTIIDCYYSVKIGKRVQIGPCCYIGDYDHSLIVDLTKKFHREEKKVGEIIICDNVWVGAGVKILRGVVVGENAVIGAGSVVTKDVEANSLYAGVPAVFIKKI